MEYKGYKINVITGKNYIYNEKYCFSFDQSHISIY
jgi:hypothetical protein